MRPSHLLLALPVLSAAQEQVPLFDQVKGWFAKATGSISSVVSSATASVHIPNPVASGAAKIAELKVERLGLHNYETLIRPGAATSAPGLETWMLFVTGGNKTCFGMCGRAETAFNESVAMIAATRNPPRLAMLDCETDGPLCYAWAVSSPALLYMHIPQPLADQSTPASIVREFHLNKTTITATEIAAYHIQEKYLERTPYEGFWHPFDGPLAKSGLQLPLGYVLWGFSKVPSWAFMIGISFISRTFMSRRVQPGGGNRAAAPAAAAQ